MGTLAKSDFYIYVKICDIFCDKFVNLRFGICTHGRVEHRSNLERELHVDQEADNLWPVLVRKILGKVLQNLFLACWVALGYFLQICRQLANYRVVINLVDLLLDLRL
jgi:hypothetical protein